MAHRFLPLRTSSRAALWAAAASMALGVVAGATLDATAVSLALVALGAFVACTLYAILSMSRYAAAVVAAAGTSLGIGSGLAFLRLLGLAWDQDPDMVTAVSGKDADPYFFGAVAAIGVTLAVLFGGAVWPERRSAAPRPSKRRPAGAAPRSTLRPSPAARKPAPGSPQARTIGRGAPSVPGVIRPRASAPSSRGARRT